jgi:YebC/PmpR family DNA-binding regulatory protein
VKRAIQKGTGEIPGVTFEEMTYEGYGPGGVAVFIEATTDNKNRTTSDLRHIFASHGGNLGESGSVAFMFEQKGFITVAKSSMPEDKITDLIIELGADDIKTEDDIYEIYTPPHDMETIKAKLIEAKAKVETAEVMLIPKNTVPLEGDVARRCLDLMNVLDDYDDVKTASANFDISKETMEKVHSSQ